ncbi:MAG: hypothetical protein R6W93_01125 [Candidatus Limnocylindrales bacterium]
MGVLLRLDRVRARSRGIPYSVFSREHDLEMLLSDHVLLRMRNVIITPHIGFATREAVQRILDTSCQNIQAFARGEMQNVID